MSTERKVLGGAVRQIRSALGIAHGRFAIDCGISPGYLTNIEAGRKQPSDAVAVRIAQRLGVHLDDITYATTSEVAS